jgi:hypothetical protein
MVAQILIFRGRKAKLIVALVVLEPAFQPHRPIRIGYRQRLEYERVIDPENGQIDAQAERQRDHRNKREAGRAPEIAPGVADIPVQLLDRHESAGIAMEFLGLLDAAVNAAGCQRRFPRRHAGALEVFGDQRQMGSDLTGHLAFGGAAAEQVGEAGEESAHLRPFGEQLFQQAGHLPPAPRLLGEGFLAGFGDRIEFGLAVGFGPVPRAGDPTLLFQADQRGIERALVELEQILRNLLEARGYGVGMLPAHGFERAENDQVQRTRQERHLSGFFTGHSSEPQFEYAANFTWLSSGLSVSTWTAMEPVLNATHVNIEALLG